ncbi:MAG TPA: DUF1569 domain-containing protein [Pirellulales bacterium]|jgi:hypothetical protein|nr:DUF1569 domain-containing protein [Pirellulales bacterium]
MAVDTKRVTGRRQLKFSCYDDILKDVHNLACRPSRQLGNWSLGEICEHLSRAMNMAIDGSSIKAPWYIRVAAPLIKRRFLSRPMNPGFQLPRSAVQLMPNCKETQQGIAALERAIERLKTEKERKPHFVFGHFTREEWDQLQLRHSEMHLGFIVPE